MFGITVEVSQFYNVAIEKQGFLTGLQNFLLLLLQFEGVMVLPGMGDIGRETE